jgi:hypothetical protein
VTDDAGPAAGAQDATGHRVEVRIEGVPLAMLERAQEHVDDLRRELALIAQSSKTSSSELPERLVTLFAELEEEYAAVNEAADMQLEQATRSNAATVDLVLTVPAGAADAAVRLDDALDEADGFCADGEYLLSLVSPPDVLAFRKWYLGEFVRQVRRAAPPAPAGTGEDG